MNIKKESISLDKHFPFKIIDQKFPPYFDMREVYHWHECLEISYVKAGQGRYHIEDKIYEMRPEDIIIINNIEPHYLKVYGQEMHQPVIIFDPSFVWSDSGSCFDYDYLRPFFERGTDFKNKLAFNNPITLKIMENIRELEKEYFEEPEGYHLMIKARLLMILTYLIRYFRDEGKKHNITCCFNKRQHLIKIEEVLKYILENFTKDIRLNDVAPILSVSPQYFSTIFKKITGMTFIEYLNNLRINHAVKLLKETDKKIIHIAVECGFNNTANFNSIFKKFIGKTPSEYRVS